jgi:hypothetical protein
VRNCYTKFRLIFFAMSARESARGDLKNRFCARAARAFARSSARRDRRSRDFFDAIFARRARAIFRSAELRGAHRAAIFWHAVRRGGRRCRGAARERSQQPNDTRRDARRRRFAPTIQRTTQRPCCTPRDAEIAPAYLQCIDSSSKNIC